MAPMPSKYEAASFHHSCTSLHDGNTRPLQGAWAIKGNGTILMEFHRLNCRRGIVRCGNLWLYSGGKFLLRHFYLLLSVPHHICLVPSTLSILAAILTTSSVSLCLSILNIPQLLCLLAPSFSQQFVPYFLTQLVLVIQPYNLVLPLTMPSFSNFLLPTFISTSPLSPIVPNFLFSPPSLLLLSSSQLWPLLFSGTASFTPYLPNELKGAGAGNTPAPRAQSCTAAAQGTTTGRFRSAQSWRKAPGQSKLLRNQTLTSKSHPTKFRLHFSKTATG